jgi:hypothetical protein
MKAVRGVEVAPPFFTSALEVSGQLHVPVSLPPGEIAPDTHWSRGSVSPKDDFERIFMCCHKINKNLIIQQRNLLLVLKTTC